jgi:type I restriction enzyme S subunit
MSSHVSAARECLIGDRRNADIKTVSELVSETKIFVEDGNHGENRPRQDEFCEKDGGIPFLRPPDLKEGRVDFKNCDFINEQGFARVRKGIGKPGDVILTHRATVGRIAIACSDAPSVFVTNPGTTVWRSLDKDLLNQRYLYFYMSSKIFQDRLFSEVGHTSTFDYVSLTQQRTLPVVIPEIRLQRRIAHILGTLDDKIELNRKTNETLEAMAKALFKSWFVDFDPVRAKAKGRPTGLPGEISDLFPDSFEDSELGKIPRGWSHSPLFDFAQFTNGASHSSQHLNSEGRGLPIVKIGELKNGLTAQTKYWDAPFESKYLVSVGDILLSWSGNPDTSIGTFVWHGEKGLLNQHIFKVTPAGGELRRSYVLLLLKHNQRVFAEIARDKQTTGLGHITIKDLRENFGIKPSAPIFGAFGKMVDPLIASCEVQTIEISHLASLRDTLLPKLISGEIRIPDAEKLLEEADV